MPMPILYLPIPSLNRKWFASFSNYCNLKDFSLPLTSQSKRLVDWGTRAEALPRLRQVITGPRGYMNGQRQQLPQEEQAPLENCVSAVAKILKHASALLGDGRAALLRDWLGWLPVTEDKEEATHVYGFLADLIER